MGMGIENLLDKEHIEVVVNEEEIQAVIYKAKAAFLESESKQLLSRREFICNQFHMIRKRWWMIQLGALCLAWLLLSAEHEQFYIRREMGVFASLFIIILIPELWRNLTNHCTEVEISAYYSLHQIYAARILLFGAADVLLLTVFVSGTHWFLHIALVDLIIQFLLPMVVTACICFAVLSKQSLNGWSAIGGCALWSGVWWAATANDKLYASIAIPIWLLVFALAILFLVVTVFRLLENCDKFMGVNLSGTVFE